MTFGTALVFILSFVSAVECDGIIAGQTIDADTGKPLADVQIATTEEALTARSGTDGGFKVTNLCPGTVLLRVTREGYISRDLETKVGDANSLDILLYRTAATQTDKVTIRSSGPKRAETRSVVSISGDDLKQTRGKSLADALADLPGISVLRSGTSAKPIVRGQHGSRLLMLHDGVRHEGQDWGMNHGPDIDPFEAGSIEVVKGSAGVRYGPDAIAGVVIVKPSKLLSKPGVRLDTHTVGALNGRRGTFAMRLEGNPEALPELAWRLDGNYSRGAGLDTPNYPLDNTGIEEWNGGAALVYEGDCWSAKLSYRRNSTTNGICLCVRKETTADFDAQVLLEAPIYSELYKADYEIDRPYHGVVHDTAIARGQVKLGDFGELEGTYAFQRNIRREYEIIRGESSRAQHNFGLRSHTVDVLFRREANALSEDLDLVGLAGVAGMLQENLYRGWPLLSDYRAFSGGIFALERLVFEDYELQFGARFDHETRHAYLPEKTYQSLAREERIDPEACTIGEDFTRCNTAFNATTFTVGGLAHLSEAISGKVDLSTATLVPTINEQYLNGTSPSFPVMARGNHTLTSETSWSASATLNGEWPKLKGEISTYGSFIDDYIYLAPELRENGTIRTDVLIQGSFPRFSYDPIDAVFYGVDADAVFRVGSVDVGVQGSLVRARNADTDEFLIFIPPDQVRGEVTYWLPDGGTVAESSVSLNATLVATQYNVAPESDFAPVPDAYALLGASASTTLYLGATRYLLHVEVQNILNSRYRDYTSLLRYFADEPGRQAFIRFGTEFGS